MPATAGRVRMPHNNRMSTSGALKTTDIWQKTIGHDPHAERDTNEPEEDQAAVAARAKSVMDAARSQNLTEYGANRDDFARKLYLGLKGGKKRRTEQLVDAAEVARQQEVERLLQEDDSSSEEEAVIVPAAKKKRGHESSSDDDDNSEEEKRRRKRRKEKRKRKKYSSDSSSEEERRRKKRKKKKRDREDGDRRRKRKEKRKEASDPFIAADSFEGSKAGYVFKNGAKGVGYYQDHYDS